MKKLVSALLVLCILVVNTFIPMAEDVTVEGGILFFDANGEYIKDVTLNVGNEYYFTCMVSTEGVDISYLNIYSSNAKVAQVYDGCRVYASRAGQTEIIAETSDGITLGSFWVNVYGSDEGGDNEGEDVTITDGFTFIGENGPIKDITLAVGQEYYFEYTGLAEGAEVSIYSSNSQVAQVYDGCYVYASGAGEAEIIAQTADGITLGSFRVYVYESDEGGNGSGGDGNGDDVIIEGGIVFFDENGNPSTEIHLEENEWYVLNYELTIEGISDETLVWESSDTSVAEFGRKGLQTLKAGTTYITVSSAEYGILGTLTVYVGSDETVEGNEPTAVYIPETITLNIGEGYWFNYYVEPEDANVDSLVWEAGDKSILSVENGYVYAYAAGETSIYVYNSKMDTLLAQCYVVVNGSEEGGEGEEGGDVIVSEQTITFYNSEGFEISEVTLDVGDEYYFSYYITSKKRADVTEAYLYSSNESVAYVSGNYICATAAGEAEIIAEVNGTTLGSLKVYVNENTEGGDGEEGGEGGDVVVPTPQWDVVFYNQHGEVVSEITLDIGERVSFSYEVISNAIETGETAFNSNDSTVATTEDGCYISAIGTGDTEIVVLYTGYNENIEYGTRLGSLIVHVNDPVLVTDIIFTVDEAEVSEIDLGLGYSLYVEADVAPSNATVKDIQWSTEDTDIISIYGNNSRCNITGIAEGTAYVTAKSADGNVEKSFKVNVMKKRVTGIELSHTELYTIKPLGYTPTPLISARVIPSDAYDQGVTWDTSDWEIADVSSNVGRVYPKKSGDVVITAVTHDGGFEATCIVHIVGHVEVESIPVLQGIECKNAFVTNSSATLENISYWSEDETIAEISETGMITGVAEGSTTVHMSFSVNGTAYSLEHGVEVKPSSGRLTETITWELSGEDMSVLTISGSGEMPDYGYGSYWQGDSSFENFSWVKEIIIEDGITYIGGHTFYSFADIDRVSIPDSVTRIGHGAFYGLDVEELVIPKNVKELGKNAFAGCTAKKVTIKGDMDTLNLQSLYFPYLEELIFEGVDVKGPSFKDAWGSYDGGSGHLGNGVSITLADSVESFNDYYNDDYGYESMKIKSITVGENVKVFSWLDSSADRVTIYWNSAAGAILPSPIDSSHDNEYNVILGNNVVNIPDSFACHFGGGAKRKLKSITFGPDVETIGNSAFAGCIKLSEVNIPAKVIRIGDNAFMDCTALTSITIPENITYIGNNAFAGSSNIKNIIWNAVNAECYIAHYYSYSEVTAFKGIGTDFNVVFGDSCEVIPELIFARSDVASVTFGNFVKTVGSKAFENVSSITEVSFPDSLETIGTDAFKGCPITSLHITKGLKDFVNGFDIIDTYTLAEDNENYIIEDGILCSADKTLIVKCMDAAKTSIVIPDTVTEIAKGAFKNNTALEEVTFGKNISCIGSEAFAGCSSLNKINWNVQVESIHWYNVFENAGTADGVEIILGEDIEKLPTNSFSYLYIKKLVVNKKLKEVGSYSFSNCPVVDLICYYGNAIEWQEINFNGSNLYYSRIILNYIPTVNENGYEYYIQDDKAYVIYYDGSLNGEEEFVIPSTLGGKPVVEIKDAFCDIDGEAGTIIIPDTVERITGNALSYINVERIVIPKRVTWISEYSLRGCDNLMAIEVNEENTAYADENGVLFNKQKTTLIVYPAGKTDASYTILDSVTVIGYSAFAYATNLKNVDLGANLETITYFAFEGCALETLTMPASVLDIGNYAFYSCQINDVYYEGTEERRGFITIGFDNSTLTNATWHYGDVKPDTLNIKEYYGQNLYYGVTLTGGEEGAQIIVAYYTEDKIFVTTTIQTYDGNEVYFDLLDEADYANVMVWKSFDNMTSVCEPKTVEFFRTSIGGTN